MVTGRRPGNFVVGNITEKSTFKNDVLVTAKGQVRISAIKPIFATFGDFDGVGQLIATKLLTKRVWMLSW